MTGFGFFLFLATVLYLIDKNQGWGAFWKGLKACAIVSLIAVLFFNGYSYWSEQRATRIAAKRIDFSKYEQIPETLPANFQGWDKDDRKPCEGK